MSHSTATGPSPTPPPSCLQDDARDPGQQSFNDDLLLHSQDMVRAKAAYERIYHALYHPELQARLAEYDAPANAAKHRSSRLGWSAVTSGTLALLGAATEPLYRHEGPGPETYGLDINAIIGLASAALGIGSVIIGSTWVLHGRSKLRWLSARLMTERLRQFHFQMLVRRLPEVVASTESADNRKAYLEERRRSLAQFEMSYCGHEVAYLGKLLERGDPSDIWLHEKSASSVPNGDDVLKEVFDAYRRLRIGHQLQYASYKIHPDGRFMSSARTQQRVFSRLGFLSVTLVFAIHLTVAAGLAVGGLLGTLAHTPAVHALAVAIAIFALTLRVLEDGLKPREEVERYEAYYEAVKSIEERFAHATDLERVGLMEEMERLAFAEMRGFLRLMSSSRFVI